VRNHWTNTDEYDDVQLFHDHQSASSYITAQQAPGFLDTSLQRFKAKLTPPPTTGSWQALAIPHNGQYITL
jgi:hypothetical protein